VRSGRTCRTHSVAPHRAGPSDGFIIADLTMKEGCTALIRRMASCIPCKSPDSSLYLFNTHNSQPLPPNSTQILHDLEDSYWSNPDVHILLAVATSIA
jgi:hypothetical protein